MSKKFLKLEGNKVTLIHNMPFDETHGFHKTEEELLRDGILLDEVPEPENIDGKIALPYYTPEKGLYYEYEDAPQEPSAPFNLADSVSAGVITPEQYEQIIGRHISN